MSKSNFNEVNGVVRPKSTNHDIAAMFKKATLTAHLNRPKAGSEEHKKKIADDKKKADLAEVDAQKKKAEEQQTSTAALEARKQRALDIPIPSKPKFAVTVHNTVADNKWVEEQKKKRKQEVILEKKLVSVLHSNGTPAKKQRIELKVEPIAGLAGPILLDTEREAYYSTCAIEGICKDDRSRIDEAVKDTEQEHHATIVSGLATQRKLKQRTDQKMQFICTQSPQLLTRRALECFKSAMSAVEVVTKRHTQDKNNRDRCCFTGEVTSLWRVQFREDKSSALSTTYLVQQQYIDVLKSVSFVCSYTHYVRTMFYKLYKDASDAEAGMTAIHNCVSDNEWLEAKHKKLDAAFKFLIMFIMFPLD